MLSLNSSLYYCSVLKLLFYVVVWHLFTCTALLPVADVIYIVSFEMLTRMVKRMMCVVFECSYRT